MSVLVIRKNGENISYSGSQFEGLENIGTHHLCINKSGVTTKYGLTSTPLDDKYKALKMRISNNSTDEVKYAYIAQRYNETVTNQSSTTYTFSSISNYISSTTLSTASKTQLSTKTTTRASNYVSSQTLVTASSSKLSTKATTRVSTHSPIYYGRNGITSLATLSNFMVNTFTIRKKGLNGKFLVNASSSTTYLTTVNAYGTGNPGTAYVNTVTTITWNSSIYTVTATQTSRVSNYVSSSTLRTNSSSKLSTKNTTRASTYTSSQTLSTASSTKLSTGNATRSSEYSTSSSLSTNVNNLVVVWYQ